jgi:hypothetical protein
MITFLRDLIFHDFWLKLFSLTLAVLIWLTVTFAIHRDAAPVPGLGLDIRERKYIDLPVVVMSSAEDVRNFKVSPNAVRVTVQGDVKTLENLRSQDIHVIVDLTGIEAARGLRKRIEISTPAGITHVLVEPQEVEILYPPKG